MLERHSRGRRNAVLLVLALFAAWFCWTIRSVLNPLLLGYLCAFILHPLVERIERRGLSRRTAVNLVFAGGFLLASGIALGVVVEVRSLALEVYRNATAAPQGAQEGAEPGPGLQERLQGRLDEFTATLDHLGLPVGRIEVPDLSEARELARTFLEEHDVDVQAAAQAGLQAAGRGVRFVTRFLQRALAFLGLFALVPLYAYYFLFELGRLHRFVRRYLPRGDRERISRVAARIGEVIASFFRGRLSVCLIKGVLLSLGLWIAGIPYALLFGMLSGALSIIPFFGPFLGFVMAFAGGILGHGVISSLVRTGIVFGVGELVEGYVLVPRILGESLGLHPLVVFVALLAGGAALGMLGILIALPLTASIVILAQEFVLPALREFADEEPEPDG